MRTKKRTPWAVAMRTTLKQLLHSDVEQGLNTPSPDATGQRSAATLPRIKGALASEAGPLSNAALVELLDA